MNRNFVKRVLAFSIAVLFAACGSTQQISTTDVSGEDIGAGLISENDSIPETIPFEDWLKEVSYANPAYTTDKRAIDFTYQHENSVLQLDGYIRSEERIALLLDSDIRLGNPKNELLKLETPFVMSVQVEDRQEVLHFSPEGIRWNGNLYFPRNCAALNTFLENEHLSAPKPIYYLGEDLNLAEEEIAYAVLSHHRTASTDVLIRDREKIAQLVDAVSNLPAQKREVMGMGANGSSAHFMICRFVMNDGTTLCINKLPGYVKINDEEPVPYDFPTQYADDPYLRDIFGDGKPWPESNEEENEFAFIEHIPQLSVTIDGKRKPELALHSYYYEENLRLYDLFPAVDDMAKIPPEMIAYYRNQPAAEITIPHAIHGERDIYKIPFGSAAICELTYTVMDKPIEPTAIEVNIYYDPEYSHPEGGTHYSYRLAHGYNLQNKKALSVDENTVILPLDRDTRIVEIIAQFPAGWVKYYFAYEESYNVWYNHPDFYYSGPAVAIFQTDSGSLTMPATDFDYALKRFQLEPANGRTQTLAITRPFEIILPFDGYEEIYTFSEDGIRYNGVPVYSGNVSDALDRFYKEIRRQAHGNNWLLADADEYYSNRYQELAALLEVPEGEKGEFEQQDNELYGKRIG